MTKRRTIKKQAIYGNEPFKYNNELKIWKVLPDLVLVGIFLVYLIISMSFLLTYSYYTVQHTSMQPLLNNYTSEELRAGISDGVYINTLAKTQVGDVIVIKNQFDFNVDTVVKRLIAVGGDKIAIRRIILPNNSIQYDVLRIPKGNTTPYILVENYVSMSVRVLGMERVYNNFNSYLVSETNKEIINEVTYLVLEDDEIFYLGDNRGSSRDCSEYGPGQKADIIGRVDIIVPRQQNMLFHVFQYLLGFKNI